MKFRTGKAFPGSAAEANEAGQKGQTSPLRKAPPPPKKIKEFLDKFIIGTVGFQGVISHLKYIGNLFQQI